LTTNHHTRDVRACGRGENPACLAMGISLQVASLRVRCTPFKPRVLLLRYPLRPTAVPTPTLRKAVVRLSEKARVPLDVLHAKPAGAESNTRKHPEGGRVERTRASKDNCGASAQPPPAPRSPAIAPHLVGQLGHQRVRWERSRMGRLQLPFHIANPRRGGRVPGLATAGCLRPCVQSTPLRGRRHLFSFIVPC
jgi:hypothetical protein